MSVDEIRIKRLILSARIGVPEEEREVPQSLAASVWIRPSFSFQDTDDQIEKTIDYYAVTQAMKKMAVDGERKLIETLAEDLANLILGFPGVSSVIVELEKFIIPNCESVSVRIERTN